MICPYCGEKKTRVVSTVKSVDNRRARLCPACKKNFLTIEHVFYDDYIKDYLKETASISKDTHNDQR